MRLFGSIPGAGLCCSTRPPRRCLGFPPAMRRQSIDRFIPNWFRSANARHLETLGESWQRTRKLGSLGPITGVRADGQEFLFEASISQAILRGERLFSVVLRD